MSVYFHVEGRMKFKDKFQFGLVAGQLLRYYDQEKKTFQTEDGATDEPGKIDYDNLEIVIPLGQYENIHKVFEPFEDKKWEFEGEIFGDSLDGVYDFLYAKSGVYRRVDVNVYARENGLDEVDFDADADVYMDQYEVVEEAFKRNPLSDPNSKRFITED